MFVLEVNGLRKSYKKGFIPKKQEVLKGVSFKVSSGEITGFLGANGAGKTTTIKCVLALAFPDAGEITFFEQGPLSLDAKMKIGFLPERPYFYEYLTGKEFLKFYGQLSGRFSSVVLRSRIESLLKRVDLWAARDKKLKDYSKGMLQKIGLAQALIHEPEFVILDEPLAGLDPDGRMTLSELIRDIAKEGMGVFFSSHLLNDVEKLCQKVIIIKNGLVEYEGGVQDLLKKTGGRFRIVYIEGGVQKVHIIDGNEGELQSYIDQLRRRQCHIIEIKSDNTLEDAFKKIGLGS
ncbi:MAG: ABC transporter ATP-binding protein [Bdellovibrio sp.]|nr:MAG: ABC transporter ATP-binding protein [Bdellovibrio sp.]